MAVRNKLASFWAHSEDFRSRLIARCRQCAVSSPNCADLAISAAGKLQLREENMSKGHHASTAFTGSPETFQRDSVGTFTYSSFPIGWHDTAQVDPNSEAPQPSAAVIKTTDAQGHITKALATLPAVADSQGIYRPIEASNFYATRADVRIDQFGEIDPAVAAEDPNNPGFLLCGCPVGTENLLDWPMQISFAYLDGATDLGHSPAAGVLASSQTHTWHLFAGTQCHRRHRP
jgi:hypothetical protein